MMYGDLFPTQPLTNRDPRPRRMLPSLNLDIPHRPISLERLQSADALPTVAAGDGIRGVHANTDNHRITVCCQSVINQSAASRKTAFAALMT